jgi:hypothetical protein
VSPEEENAMHHLATKQKLIPINRMKYLPSYPNLWFKLKHKD